MFLFLAPPLRFCRQVQIHNLCIVRVMRRRCVSCVRGWAVYSTIFLVFGYLVSVSPSRVLFFGVFLRVGGGVDTSCLGSTEMERVVPALNEANIDNDNNKRLIVGKTYFALCPVYCVKF